MARGRKGGGRVSVRVSALPRVKKGGKGSKGRAGKKAAAFY